MSFKKKIKDKYYQEVNIDLDSLKQDLNFKEESKPNRIKRPILGISLGLVMSVIVVLLMIMIYNFNDAKMSYSADSAPHDSRNGASASELAPEDNGGSNSYSGEVNNQGVESNIADGEKGSNDSAIEDEASSDSQFFIEAKSAKSSVINDYEIGRNQSELSTLYEKYSSDILDEEDLGLIDNYYVIVVNGDVLDIELGESINIKTKQSNKVSFIFVSNDITYDEIVVTK